MKVAVTSRGATLDDQVDPRFGRCANFVIVETEDMSFEAVANSNAAAGGGAGIQSAQSVAGRDVKAVLTGNCGPNAFRTLDAAGIKVVVGAAGTVREAVEAYKAGNLKAAGGPNVESHTGTNPSNKLRVADNSTASEGTFGSRFGPHGGHTARFRLGRSGIENGNKRKD